MKLAHVALSLASALLLSACGPSKGPEAGSQTNWLIACASADDCGGLQCVCGACTATCASDDACTELPGSACIAADDEGSIALCGGRAAEHGVCLPRCDGACAEGTSCIAGVCAPTAIASARVLIDTGVRHQALVGFGASLAYADDAVVAREDKAELYELLFADAGIDALRLRNRYEAGNSAPLETAQEIVEAAAARLGRAPFLFMTSGTPPAALKANGELRCGGSPETCTLNALGDSFDYAGFAAYWRDALQAYAEAGVVPDYISIQNNPDWVPPAQAPHDACMFLPEEGTQSVMMGSERVDVAYPGYREALAAVRAAIVDLPSVPKLAAPEATGLGDVSGYAAVLEASSMDALALHMYGQDARAVDVALLESARAIGEQLGRPVFQTEMQAEGFETALLVQHALTAANAALYLQNDLVAVTPGAASISLVELVDDGLVPQGPYYALAHFAKHTDPGWVRVDASTDTSELLASAFVSPDDTGLTIVLVNAGDADLDAELALPEAFDASRTRSAITRTVFDGVERAARLGALSSEGVVRMPPRSIMTIAFAPPAVED